MNTKRSILIALTFVAALAGGISRPAQAQGGIWDMSPLEGTVGTLVTITGAGFGAHRGEVLLGEEKCKVSAWSDTEIAFIVDKPQRPNEYPVTVLLQGEKKSAEPMTFEAFGMRRPKITSGQLIRDGAEATVVGEFFGDKKGVLRLGYVDSEAAGEVTVDDPKILDWSMNTIRFEVPLRLTRRLVVAIHSEVGTGLALLDLAGGMLGQVAPPPGVQGGESYENASGVFYKSLSADDNFYVFSDTYNPGYGDNYRVNASIFHPVDGRFVSIGPPKHETEVPIQPLVVKDTAGKETLWMFHTGHLWTENLGSTVIWYAKYYDPGTIGEYEPYAWTQIPNVSIDERNTVAPVYDPRNHRISVYYNKDDRLRWVYTDDHGAHWSESALVGAETGGVPVKQHFVSAIYWPSATTTALVTSTGQVVAVNNGEYRGSIGHLTDDFWRPYLVDLGGETALLYQNHAEGDNTPTIAKLNYGTPANNRTWSWFGAEPLVTLPDTGVPLTGYNYQWSPRGGLTRIGDERHLYVFYGVQLWEAYTEETVERWYLLDKGPVSNTGVLPAIDPTPFKETSAGEIHACAVKTADGTLECWGNNDYGKLNRPAGTFLQASAGFSTSCGVKADHSIACWGKNDYNLVSSRPTSGYFTQVSVGKMVACGLKSDNTVVCWGDAGDGRTIPQSGMTQISAGDFYSCGVKTDGTVHCWGDDDGTGRTVPPPPPYGRKYTKVSAATWHTCAVRSDGPVVCWGDNDEDRVGPTPTLAAGLTYREVSAGSWHTCALVSDGSIRCWGDDTDGRVSSTPKTTNFTQIEAGIRNTCATRQDGGITCWGNNSDRQSLPPF